MPMPRRTLQRLQKRLTLSQIQDGHMSKTQGSWSENIILPVLLASSVAYRLHTVQTEKQVETSIPVLRYNRSFPKQQVSP